MPEDPESKIGSEGLYSQLLAEAGQPYHIWAPESAAAAIARRELAVITALQLHKPEFFGGVIACLACSPGMPPPLLVEWKDCQTVRVIASALGVET